MLPQFSDDLKKDFEFINQPTRTYRMVLDKKIISGMTDELEAVKQAIFMILNTERFQHEIYSWDYGIETEDFIGSQVPLLYSKLKQSIMDALIQDDRILAVKDFSFTKSRDTVTAVFTVETEFGEIEAEKEVRL
ncbi:DUF2634 domain-containing protein [Anaerolentibacter hominis]|uniref:DUF2634 domain-containing protein n=1 Tax=Anaerolentibacter hominis TaxID=3079009 RepID=UPI0031B89671